MGFQGPESTFFTLGISRGKLDGLKARANPNLFRVLPKRRSVIFVGLVRVTEAGFDYGQRSRG
jgi:hypothetical protein